MHAVASCRVAFAGSAGNAVGQLCMLPLGRYGPPWRSFFFPLDPVLSRDKTRCRNGPENVL